jgi:outer membrane biosynthesis protein TonB
MKHPRLSFTTIAFLLFAFANSGADNSYVVVNKDIARVMLMPYGDAKLVGMAKKGDRCKVITKKGDWFNVDFKGSIGWIFQANVDVAETGSAATALPPATQPAKQSQPSASPPPPQPPQVSTPSRVPAQPVAPQNSAQEIPKEQPVVENAASRPEEKQETSGETTQRKSPRKQKKPLNVTVDLPPASVMPIHASKEAASSAPESAGAVSRSVQPLQQAKPLSEKSQSGDNQAGQQGTGQKFFEITESPARILASVSPDSPILGIARNSECYPLLYAGTSWCKIQFGTHVGWVDRRYGRIVDTPPATAKIPQIVLFALLGGAGVLLLGLAILLIVISLRTKPMRKVAVKKDLLVVAKSEKQIQYSLTDTTTTLSKCFSEIGFQIETASTFERAASLLAHYVPDVIVIDWQVGDNALSFLESTIATKRSASDILVIFYNVPGAEAVAKRAAMQNVHFLGMAFSDRDIFRLVTPLIMSLTGRKSIRKSVETSALGGEIGQGSLIEVMQFIEIGSKTGCLYVVIDKPFGLIYFEQGRLSYAATQTQQGREAVFEMLNLKKGHFHFVLDKTSRTKNVNLSTLEILMEWTKTVDEAHRR